MCDRLGFGFWSRSFMNFGGFAFGRNRLGRLINGFDLSGFGFG
jgi:hypothetical protein